MQFESLRRSFVVCSKKEVERVHGGSDVTAYRVRVHTAWTFRFKFPAAYLCILPSRAHNPGYPVFHRLEIELIDFLVDDRVSVSVMVQTLYVKAHDVQ